MHATIEAMYDKYLEEQVGVESELNAWVDKFQDQAARNGWIPATESRSADYVLEVHKQRFFLTKQRINELALENPDANLSTNSPFTLLSDEEFGTYVANAFVVSNASTSIESQGQCGDCWASAIVGAVEAAQCIANGQTSMIKYSEQQLVSCNSHNNGCGGGAPVYALEYVAENGLCTENDFPYTSSSGVSGSSCSNSCTKYSTGVSGSISLTAGDEDALNPAVAQHPVIVAVASGNTAWKQYAGGILATCDSSSLDHAVLVVGYDSSAFKIKNSWGTDWGDQGYVHLRRGASGGMGTCGMLTDMHHLDLS